MSGDGVKGINLEQKKRGQDLLLMNPSSDINLSRDGQYRKDDHGLVSDIGNDHFDDVGLEDPQIFLICFHKMWGSHMLSLQDRTLMDQCWLDFKMEYHHLQRTPSPQFQ